MFSAYKSTQISAFSQNTSFTPRFLQNETVNFINDDIISHEPSVYISEGSISKLHAKSRTLINKKKHAFQGISSPKALNSVAVSAYNFEKA